MGLFGLGNYNKPGPGVNKDDPVKIAPIRFFEIFARKFTKFIQANLLFMIPVAVVCVLMFLIYLSPIHFVFSIPFGDSVYQVDFWAIYIATTPIILLSPFIGGLTFISRNFSREEHAFIGSDFWRTTKANWKAFLLNGLICHLAFVVLSFSFLFYFTSVNKNAFYYVPLIITLFVSVLFIFAQYYVPVMIITFDLKLRQIYKNAFILAILGAPRNIMLTIIFIAMLVVIIMFGLTTMLGIFITFLVTAIILFAFSNYLINFTVYSLIDRYLIQPTLESTDNDSAEIPSNTEFTDSQPTEANDEDYVYVNGRLIKKKDLNDD